LQAVKPLKFKNKSKKLNLLYTSQQSCIKIFLPQRCNTETIYFQAEKSSSSGTAGVYSFMQNAIQQILSTFSLQNPAAYAIL